MARTFLILPERRGFDRKIKMKNIKDAKIVVVKVGTSTLTYPSGMLNLRRIDSLVKTICDLQNSGRRMILVSSGAVSAGLAKIGFLRRPDSIEEKQAAAAVGQCELMNMYEARFASFGHKVAQILITRFSVESDVMRRNAEGTFRVLLEMGCIPIVNENDTVSVAEFGIGDNDTLSAIVATSVHADLLVLLSDIDGLYTADPHKDPDAARIELVPEITDEILRLADGKGSELGTGGMKTKLSAAKIVTKAGTDMIIANGAEVEKLYALLDGKSIGTRFLGRKASV